MSATQSLSTFILYLINYPLVGSQTLSLLESLNTVAQNLGREIEVVINLLYNEVVCIYNSSKRDTAFLKVKDSDARFRGICLWFLWCSGA